MLFLVIHLLGCTWIKMGHDAIGGWLDNPDYVPDLRHKPMSKIYICAVYWVTCTLTTVGYGEIKPLTNSEYIYTMIVEFFGFMVFGLIMASINNVLMSKPDHSDQLQRVIDGIDIWLVTIGKMKPEKCIPKLLYENIKMCI